MSFGSGWPSSCPRGKVVMEQGRDDIRKGQAGALLTCTATLARHGGITLPQCPSLQELRRRLCQGSQHGDPTPGEEVVENKACTGLAIEGIILKSSKSHLLTPNGHATGVTQPWVELLGSTAASCQEGTHGDGVWRFFGSINTFCCF